MTRRPTFINLFLIKLPISAISSITHRLTGIAIFFIALPTFVLLFLTDYLATNQSEWDLEKYNFEIKLLLSVSLIALTYHTLAGLRHMLIDFTNYGHELNQAKLSAIITFVLAFIISIFLLTEIW
tara:strand:+ start:1266 stop:1640 length:375 start_codon:yes stop_codon:yes gene_type:complete